jgi:hypothetical protein
LRLILNELREAEGKPQTGPILRGPSGKPLNLENLARREIIPTLRKDASLPQWRGWYAFRRGIATELMAATHDPLTAKGMLRHSNVSTTMAHYVKDVPESTRRGMQKLEEQFNALSKRSVESTPTQSVN